MGMALDIVLLVLFYNTTISAAVMALLARIGDYFIFKKCGIAPWHALVPYYEAYEAARCGNREQEGRVIFILNIVMVLMSIGTLFIP